MNRFLSFLIVFVLLAGCTSNTLFRTFNDTHFFSDVVTIEAFPSPRNHILLIVDDSNSMHEKIGKLKDSLTNFVTLLRGQNVNYYLHMVLLSELNTSQIENGTIALPNYLTTGLDQVQVRVDGLQSTELSKEFGLAALAGAMKKLFPHVDSLSDESQLVPYLYTGPPLLPAAQLAISDFFDFPVGFPPSLKPNALDGMFPPNERSLDRKDRLNTLNNLFRVAANYDYFTYDHFRDQLQGIQINYVYPLILSDEDNESHLNTESGNPVLVGGVPETFHYRYKRVFVQSIHFDTATHCVKDASVGADLERLHSYLPAHYKTGPVLRNGFYCDGGDSRPGVFSSFDATGSSVWSFCDTRLWDCKTIDNEGVVSANYGNQNYGAWQAWDFGIIPFTGLPHAGVFQEWKNNPAKWNEPTAMAPILTYNNVCRVDPASPTTSRITPHDNLHPLKNIPGVENCTPAICQETVFTPYESNLTGNVFSVQPRLCDTTAGEFLDTGARVQIPPADVNGRSHIRPYEHPNAVIQSGPLPGDVEVAYYLAEATGTYESDVYLTDAQAVVAIRNYLSGLTQDNIGRYENAQGVDVEEINRHWRERRTSMVPEEITITSSPDDGVSGASGETRYATAEHVGQWLKEEFPQLKITVSAIVKYDSNPCPGETANTSFARGQAYLDLKNSTGGIEQNICGLGTAQDFDAFMSNLGQVVIEGNLQTFILQEDPSKGELRIVNETTGQRLVEGTHYRLESGVGPYGYVVFLRETIPAGHQIRVGLFPN